MIRLSNREKREIRLWLAYILPMEDACYYTWDESQVAWDRNVNSLPVVDMPDWFADEIGTTPPDGGVLILPDHAPIVVAHAKAEQEREAAEIAAHQATRARRAHERQAKRRAKLTAAG